MPAKGYAVLRPNYRGSTGYGDKFLRDMVNGYFKQSHLDVIAGTDAVIAMGVADPDKLVKMGWSAGGHMTNKIITFTDRFKAASSGAGAANWISMYAQSDHREFRTPWFGGTPWQANAPIDLYWNNSPLKDVVEGQDADDLPGGRAGSARADAAVGRDVSRAEVERRADASLRGAARGPRLDRAPSPALQAPDRDGVVREVHQQPRLRVGEGAGRREEGTRRSRRRPRHNDARALDSPVRCTYKRLATSRCAQQPLLELEARSRLGPDGSRAARQPCRGPSDADPALAGFPLDHRGRRGAGRAGDADRLVALLHPFPRAPQPSRHRGRRGCSGRGSASGASTSPSAGRGTSPTSCSGSGSATPER